MIAALIIIGAWQTLAALLLLAGARLGLVRVTVARPAKRTETPK